MQARWDLGRHAGGITAFSFYNYGVMLRRSLGWTRDVVRAVRNGL